MTPCKDCEKRYVGCHSKCEEYIEFDTKNRAEREAKYKAKQLNQEAKSYQIEEALKHKARTYTNWRRRK